MLLSVIIPTCHRNDHLAACVAALAPGVQTLAAERYQVVVSDDGSRSSAEELIKSSFSWARWVQGPRRGPAANRNHGAASSEGEWLVFVDDDCIPQPRFLEAYAEGIACHGDLPILEGRTFADRPRRSLAEVSPINETGGYIWSCNFAIRREAFAKLAGFDERFPYPAMEDVDFRHRLKAAEFGSAFLPEAAVCHPWRLQNLRKEAVQYEASVAIFLRKHQERIRSFTFRSQMAALARVVVKDTLPSLIRFRGAGGGAALKRHYYQLEHAFRSLYRYGF